MFEFTIRVTSLFCVSVPLDLLEGVIFALKMFLRIMAESNGEQLESFGMNPADKEGEPFRVRMVRATAFQTSGVVLYSVPIV